MNRTLITTAIVASMTGLLGMTAANAADRIDRVQANQQQRIQQGIRSGELTRFEAARLRAEQARIAQIERRAKRDGYVSPAERRRIAIAQSRASRNIYAEKHDAQERGRGHRRWFRRWW